MSVVPLSIDDLSRRGGGIPVASLDKKTWNFCELAASEVDKINKVFSYGIAFLKKVLPSVAMDIERQRSLALTWAGVAKATFPVRKNYEFPSTTGSLGVAWLFPEAIKYAATPGPSVPCYTSYATNSWDISLTAGTAAYFFGDGTNFYKASPQTDKHSFLLIFENGIIEFGSTPKIDTFRLISEGKRDYGIYSVVPLEEIPIEKGVVAYQYPTPLGALPISYDRGIMWGFMPKVTGTSTIKLLGLVFYEHDLYPDLASTWI
jgi:hypothetical protein